MNFFKSSPQTTLDHSDGDKACFHPLDNMEKIGYNMRENNPSHLSSYFREDI